MKKSELLEKIAAAMPDELYVTKFSIEFHTTKETFEADCKVAHAAMQELASHYKCSAGIDVSFWPFHTIGIWADGSTK